MARPAAPPAERLTSAPPAGNNQPLILEWLLTLIAVLLLALTARTVRRAFPELFTTSPQVVPAPRHGAARHATTGSTTARVEVGILGPYRITGIEQVNASQTRAGKVILYLALSGNTSVSTDRLARALGRPGKAADGRTCRKAISHAARLLGVRSDGRAPILEDATGYRLHPEVGLDWRRFEALIASAITSPGHLHDALALVRGPILADVEEWWIDTGAIAVMRRRVVHIADRAASNELANDDAVAAAGALACGLRADPTDAHLRSRLRALTAPAGN